MTRHRRVMMPRVLRQRRLAQTRRLKLQRRYFGGPIDKVIVEWCVAQVEVRPSGELHFEVPIGAQASLTAAS